MVETSDETRWITTSSKLTSKVKMNDDSMSITHTGSEVLRKDSLGSVPVETFMLPPARSRHIGTDLNITFTCKDLGLAMPEDAEMIDPVTFGLNRAPFTLSDGYNYDIHAIVGMVRRTLSPGTKLKSPIVQVTEWNATVLMIQVQFMR